MRREDIKRLMFYAGSIVVVTIVALVLIRLGIIQY